MAVGSFFNISAFKRTRGDRLSLVSNVTPATHPLLASFVRNPPYLRIPLGSKRVPFSRWDIIAFAGSCLSEKKEPILYVLRDECVQGNRSSDL